MVGHGTAWDAARRRRGDQAALLFAVILTLAMFASQAFHLFRTVEGSAFDNQRVTELSTIAIEVLIFFVAMGGWLFFMARVRSTRDRLIEEEAMRLRVQDELVEAQKMEVLGQMAAGIAHDFGNQLAVINGSLDAAASSSNPASPEALHLARARTASGQALHTVESLMVFSRRSAGRKVPVDLTDIAEEASALARAMLPANVDVDLRLPSTPLWAEGDRTQLVQVLLNLILNAREAMPDGGEIAIEAACVGEAHASACPQVRISVADTGIGMTCGVVDRVFEPFFTLSEARGTGLGLSVVHGIVSSMDGTIEVTSTPGVGTRFEIVVPTAQGRKCSEVVPIADRVSGPDRVAVDLGDGYRSSLVVAALGRSGFEAEVVDLSLLQARVDLRVIIAQGRATEFALGQFQDGELDLILVDPPGELKLPGNARAFTSPVPISRLITEVASCVGTSAGV
jgi:signal transduction histidine kinase